MRGAKAARISRVQRAAAGDNTGCRASAFLGPEEEETYVLVMSCCCPEESSGRMLFGDEP